MVSCVDEQSDMNGGMDNQAFSDDEKEQLGKSVKKQAKDAVVTISMSTMNEGEEEGWGHPELCRNQSEESFVEGDTDETEMFGKKTKQSGTIDVWWLFDDGGKNAMTIKMMGFIFIVCNALN